MMILGLKHILLISITLFSIGVFGILARRNILGLLMSIELLFNGVGLNFVAFNRYLHPGSVSGHASTLFVIALAAAEAVVGLALVLTLTRSTKSVLVEKYNILKG